MLPPQTSSLLYDSEFIRSSIHRNPLWLTVYSAASTAPSARPLGWLLRKLGGIPVDRKKGSNVALSVIKEMKAQKVVHLALAPEGTRKPVKRWKTGFHTIARQVGCPVYMGYFDWGTKRVSRGQKVELTDDAKADMARIQALYEEMHLVGKHPEKYITH